MNPEIKIACDKIIAGKVIAYPTESVYGLGCDPQNLSAIKNLLKLKQRSYHKGLIIVASKLEQFSPYIQELNALQKERILTTKKITTWIVPAKTEVSHLLCGQKASSDIALTASKNIAIRVSSHAIIKEICNYLDQPIVSTSANITGHAMCYSTQELEEQFKQSLDYILKGELGGSQKTSQIIELASGNILRE